MRNPRPTRRGFAAALALTLSLPVAATAATQLVTPANLGVDWFNAQPEADTRLEGTVGLLAGPGAVPAGLSAGSAHMDTACAASAPGCSQAKGQLMTYQFGSLGEPGAGVLLADINAMSYWTWRGSSSTNPITQVVSINMEVDYVGDGTSYTTLVYEPYYNRVRQGPITTDEWQFWDAYDGGQAIWWSTRTIPGLPAFTFATTWAQIVAANPNARIVAKFGLNTGSGWSGVHDGATDGLTLGLAGQEAITFDFEPVADIFIDLRPNNTANQVNTTSRQLVPVALLGSDTFDPVNDVDITSVESRGALASSTRFDTDDVNGDGFADLTVYFRARDLDDPTPEECADPDAQLVVTGATNLGGLFQGSDFVDWQGPACN